MHYQALIREFIITPIVSKIKKAAEVVEFEIYDGFDDADPYETVKNLISLYCDLLRRDPLWHFFNEGDFMVVRCSNLFSKDVKKWLDDNGFTNYKGPKAWEESTYVTQHFQYNFFLKMFHQISEGVMTIIFDDARNVYGDYEDYCIRNFAERIIHAWFNHNMMFAIVFGKKLKRPIDCQRWEAELVGSISLDRALYGGKYEFLRALELKKKQEENGENGKESEDN